MQLGFKFHIKQADSLHFHIKLMPNDFPQGYLSDLTTQWFGRFWGPVAPQSRREK